MLGLDVDQVLAGCHSDHCLVLVGHLEDLVVGLLGSLMVWHRYLLDSVDYDFLLHSVPDYFDRFDHFDHFLFEDFPET